MVSGFLRQPCTLERRAGVSQTATLTGSRKGTGVGVSRPEFWAWLCYKWTFWPLQGLCASFLLLTMQGEGQRWRRRSLQGTKQLNETFWLHVHCLGCYQAVSFDMIFSLNFYSGNDAFVHHPQNLSLIPMFRSLLLSYNKCLLFLSFFKQPSPN